MSIRVSRAVWQHFRAGGNQKLVLLAFADWADDSGGNIYPAMATIAAKVCCSEDQARRTVHALIACGVVKVVGNANGGPPGTTRQYRIDLERLTARVDASPTPCADATPTGGTNATRQEPRPLAPVQVDPLHPCGFTPCTDASLSVIEPSVISEGRARSTKLSAKRATQCPKELDVNDQMIAWAIAEGVPEERVMPESSKFLDYHTSKGSTHRDWIAAWRNWMRKSVEFSKGR